MRHKICKQKEILSIPLWWQVQCFSISVSLVTWSHISLSNGVHDFITNMLFFYFQRGQKCNTNNQTPAKSIVVWRPNGRNEEHSHFKLVSVNKGQSIASTNTNTSWVPTLHQSRPFSSWFSRVCVWNLKGKDPDLWLKGVKQKHFVYWWQ